MTNLAHAAGWYPDPSDSTMQRWWDGAQWTQHVQPAAAAGPGAGAAAAANLRGGFQSAPKTSGLAIAALVCAFLMPLIGFILGIVGLVKIKRSQSTAAPQTGAGMAIAAIVISCVVGLLTALIVMAVAVPVFVGQKSGAESTMAKTNVKFVVNAVETCAVSNPDGSYTGCGAAALPKIEPALGPILERGCSAANGACVELTSDRMGYEVSATTPGEGKSRITFTETHASDGEITRTCAPVDGITCTRGTW